MSRQSNVLYKQVTLIDTSAVVAIHDDREAHHQIAKLFFESQKVMAWTSLDVTAHESFTRVRYNTDLPQAMKAFDFLRSKPVKFIPFLAEDEIKARDLLTKYSDHRLSFHDVLCAAVMLRLGIYKVFTFDKDFLILGFDIFPRSVI